MANQEHLDILRQDVEAWNAWRKANPGIDPDLRDANLSGANLSGANLSGANLSDADLGRAFLSHANLYGASLSGANLWDAHLEGANLSRADLFLASLFGTDLEGANLSRANLTGAILRRADLRRANLEGAILEGANLFDADLFDAHLEGANLEGANLEGANLEGANLEGATLMGANLQRCVFVGTTIEDATLTGCGIHGLSVWNLSGTPKDQSNLVITRHDEPTITVDDLEVAQFIYLMLNNDKVRKIIDTIGKKGVLILGRFLPTERKHILDALRTELRRLGYLPMVFDFDRPTNRDFTETVMTLAGMSRFIIADITNPKSTPLELQATVPNYMIPFVPIIQEGEQPFAMFKDLHGKFDWVLDTLTYDSAANLIQGLEPAVIRPALAKHDELMIRKAASAQTRRIQDYLK